MTNQEAIVLIEEAIESHCHNLHDLIAHEPGAEEYESMAEKFEKAMDMVQIVAKPVLPSSGC